MREVAGRTAVVTGAASGIGRAVARRLGKEGMRVVIADVATDDLERVRRELEDAAVPVIAVPTDVSDRAAMERLRDAALEAFGAVHVVHNNAGVALPPMPVWEVDETLWEWIIGVNLRSVINGIRTFVPLLVAQDEGHVVNTSSLGGLISNGRLGAYSTTKYGVVALTEALRGDLRRAGANVGASVVCPALVPTNLGATSARNWPADAPRPDLSEPRHDPAVRSSAQSPEAVAEMILAAILDNRLYVITHKETRGIVSKRFDAILAACPPDADS